MRKALFSLKQYGRVIVVRARRRAGAYGDGDDDENYVQDHADERAFAARFGAEGQGVLPHQEQDQTDKRD